MLTYEDLKSFFHKEKSQNQLVSLPKDFFDQTESYFETKDQLSGEDRWELEDAKNCFIGIREMRIRKILLLAFDFARAGVYPENLTEKEKIFFDQTVASIKAFQKTKKIMPTTVVLLQDVPAFVAPDMKTYGPFKKEEQVSLPKNVEQLFIKKGMAKPAP